MTVGFYGMVTKSKRTTKGKRGEPGRFVTLKSGRVIFIPKGYKKKWSDVRDKISATGGTGRYTVETEVGEVEMYKVASKGEVPPSAAVISGGKMPLVMYNAYDKTWHFLPGDSGVAHAEVGHGPLGRRIRGRELDTHLIRGTFDPRTGLVELYDQAEDAGYGVDVPYKKRGLEELSARSRRSAIANLFTYGGRQPKLGHTVYGWGETWLAPGEGEPEPARDRKPPWWDT